MIGLTIGLGLSAQPVRAAAGGGLNVELWVQPLFDASTGVTLGKNGAGTTPAITGGELVFTAGTDGYAYATALETLVPGTYHLEVNVTGATDDGFDIYVGGTVGNLGTDGERWQVVDGSTGTKSTDLVVAAVAGQLITIYDSNNEGPILSAFSAKQTA